MARAINNNADNKGSVVASVVTSGGSTQLVLTSGKSGAGGAVSLNTSGLTSSTLKTQLSSGNALVPAQDAVVWLGDQTTGVRMQQSSNTFTAVQG